MLGSWPSVCVHSLCVCNYVHVSEHPKHSPRGSEHLRIGATDIHLDPTGKWPVN